MIDAHGWDDQLATTVGQLIAHGVEPGQIRMWVEQSIDSAQALDEDEVECMASILEDVQKIMCAEPSHLRAVASYARIVAMNATGRAE